MGEAFSGGFRAIFAFGAFQAISVLIEWLAAGSVISKFGEAFFGAAFCAFTCVCASVFIFFFFVFERGDQVCRGRDRDRGREIERIRNRDFGIHIAYRETMVSIKM